MSEPKFCSACESILYRNTKSGTMIFICDRCKNTEPATDDDTLIYEEPVNNKLGDIIYKHLIKEAPNLPFIGKEPIGCKKCSNKNIARIYLTENRIPVYSCECGYSWKYSE